jgi:glutaredoxin
MAVELIRTMRWRATLGLALLLCAAGAGAQVFKWVDDKGVVHYSDTPPPPTQKKVELKSFKDSGAGVELPYELNEAVKANPVTLYTTSECDFCDRGRTLLKERGIPFAEKTVNSNDDQQRLKDAGSPGQLPLLLVGRSKLIGFESGGWNAALDAAAYPAKSKLPSAYQYPLAESAAPARAPAPTAAALAATAAAARAAAAAAEAARRAPKPAPTAPPGFQF